MSVSNNNINSTNINYSTIYTNSSNDSITLTQNSPSNIPLNPRLNNSQKRRLNRLHIQPNVDPTKMSPINYH